jgi:uncharacterized membrane protein
MTLPQLPHDKAMHVLYGLACFCVFALISPLVGLVAAIVVGAAKEAWDSTGRGNVEILDFVATAAGGLLGFYCTFL